MTDAQKKKIAELRANGYSYNQIADTVKLSVNTVKTCCRRMSNIAPVHNPPKTDSEHCPVCNKVLVHIPGRRKKKFCSDACRMAWWTKHQDCIKHTNVHDIICQHCGKSFSVYGNSNRKYCSHACYIKERFGGQYAE